MRSAKAGKVAEGIWYFGRAESGIYLLEGSSSMIISGGMSWIVSDVLEQMERFGIDEPRIDKLLILHAHFDHIGLVPFFKRRFPGLTVHASAEAWRAVNDPGSIEAVNMHSRGAAERHGRSVLLETHDLAWRNDVQGVTVAEGDSIDCGSFEVRIFEIPGHSPCSIAAYVPALKALFPSDGGGIPLGKTIIPSGNSDYTLFQESLEKLKVLKVDLLCADHGGYVTGNEASRFIGDTLKAAAKFRVLVERICRRTGSVESTVRRLISLSEAYSDNFLPRDILYGIYSQMVNHIVSEMDRDSEPAGNISAKQRSRPL
ncbi:MAG: MBL fold metallo-hydrolase [Syntrophales bacterium]|nr:MBL fold metallo-hydrolase [Syntrophales bacterium]